MLGDRRIGFGRARRAKVRSRFPMYLPCAISRIIAYVLRGTDTFLITGTNINRGIRHRNRLPNPISFVFHSVFLLPVGRGKRSWFTTENFTTSTSGDQMEGVVSPASCWKRKVHALRQSNNPIQHRRVALRRIIFSLDTDRRGKLAAEPCVDTDAAAACRTPSALANAVVVYSAT